MAAMCKYRGMNVLEWRERLLLTSYLNESVNLLV